MGEIRCCAVFGHHPMRFAWGFDEEAEGCRALKMELLQQIMALCRQGITQFAVVADCGIGLYAGEMLNILREKDTELQLFCVTPHEEQATKWAPYLRERYFDLLIKCTRMEAVSLRRTSSCEDEAYRRIIDYADIALAVYDASSARGDTIDQAVSYAETQGKALAVLHPDTLELSCKKV